LFRSGCATPPWGFAGTSRFAGTNVILPEPAVSAGIKRCNARPRFYLIITRARLRSRFPVDFHHRTFHQDDLFAKLLFGGAVPIPPLDLILNVLPPHLGAPTVPSQLSPYPCSTVELCASFATTPHRREIVAGFLALRVELGKLGIRGFQWLSGSFTEGIEVQERRNPNDIDVVTFVADPLTEPEVMDRFVSAKMTDLLVPAHTKKTYKVDHYAIVLGCPPVALVDQVRYWYGLFSHRRDRTWKGMLSVPLPTPSDDALAQSAVAVKP
jgi:hypothetical protein